MDVGSGIRLKEKVGEETVGCWGKALWHDGERRRGRQRQNDAPLSNFTLPKLSCCQRIADVPQSGMEHLNGGSPEP